MSAYSEEVHCNCSRAQLQIFPVSISKKDLGLNLGDIHVHVPGILPLFTFYPVIHNILRFFRLKRSLSVSLCSFDLCLIKYLYMNFIYLHICPLRQRHVGLQNTCPNISFTRQDGREAVLVQASVIFINCSYANRHLYH